MAVAGLSLSTDRATDGRCTKVLESVLSLAAMDGAIVDAIDMVLSLLPLVEEAMLVVLVCEPGAGVYPFAKP